MPSILHAKQILKLQSLLTRSQLSISATTAVVPKGHFAVYVGEAEKKRFVVPISYLNNPSFQKFLSHSEEEFASIIQWVESQSHARKNLSSI
ncbi:Auxin-responsive protein SAUR20 [Vitis vinifera]|uniref:Auxin-responsive protein SAUR20 n=1 Tax=Vitis vinifera TaxID=29760 RepID=A0A438JEC7_VITVI|nr:Auxin-responsive protein SAUR20 [Vitis vinifera]